MKIKGKVLISVEAADLKNGKFFNKDVTEIADKCFFELNELISVSLPKVTKIGSDCFNSNQALTEVNLPALTTAGSYCFNYNQALTEVNLPALTTAGSYCFSYNQALTEVIIGKKKLEVKNVDGYCFIIEKEKISKGIKIYTGYNFIQLINKKIDKHECYVAEKDTFFAHGETVKKAISDLQFKIVAEKLKKEPINKDTIITMRYYRIITGACELGVKSWMEQNGIKVESIKAVDLLPILKKTNAYGFERFKTLITW